MMLQQGNEISQSLPAWYVLSVTADSVSAGSVSRLNDQPGGEPAGVTSIAAGTTTSFGPLQYPARYLINCTAGELTIATVPMAVQALAVTALDDQSGGTPGGTIGAVGDTSAGDESATINDNFASLNQQIEDLKAAMVQAGTLAS